ncbi:MAG: polyprenyl synthetase family protein, partial [archaeon]
DDYIDFASEETGKTRGSDIKKGKKTSIVCHGLKNMDPIKKNELLRILKAPVNETSEEMINRAVELLNESGSIEFAKKEATGFVDSAIKNFDILELSEAKNEIMKISKFLVNRVV